MKRNMSNMNNIMMKLFMVIMLMMFSMGAEADVKVLFGENGDDVFSGKGGTIEVSQEPDEKDETKVIVTLTVTPKKNYSISKDDIKVYAVLPASVRSTRGLEISNELTLDGKDPQNLSEKRDYTVTIDSKLGLWVRTAVFTNTRKGVVKTTSKFYFIANNASYNSSVTTNNYYFVPAKDPHQANKQDAWYSSNYNASNGDPEKPFITTFKTDCDNNSIWEIISFYEEGDEGEDDEYLYSHLKHWATGKYLIYEPPHSNAINRKCVHLQTTTSPGENARFDIITNGTGVNIRPISLTSGNQYLNPASGNKDFYYGQGNSPYYGGMVGVWSEATANSIWHLDETIEPPSFTVNADGTVEILSATGTTIYYTTNGNNPTTSDGEYTGAITVTSDMTAIKAIAVRTSDSKTSNVVTLPLQTYTYHIVNCAGDIAVKYELKQTVGKTLSSYLDIPAAIQSPYLEGETASFYTFSEAYSSTDQLSDENQITETPESDAIIYVTYTTDHLREKFLKLRGASAFNITADGKAIYDDSGSLASETTDYSSAITTANHLWNFLGEDPYAVQIQNFDTDKYLVFSTPPTLSLAAAATNNFILMAGSASGDGTTYEQINLMAATGTGTPDLSKIEIRAYPVSSSVTYHLIDKAGKLIVSVPSTSSELVLPSEWQSPLVSEYHYYKEATLSGNTIGSTCDFTGATTISSPFDVGNGGDIYVNYTAVNNAIDITGGKTYMLKFLYGEEFYQEDEKDKILTEKKPAIYPYNNGDFNLYVYGQVQWDNQLAKGASTRKRWLWHVISDNGDPYHVIFKSEQDQVIKTLPDETLYSGNTYLRTYQPNGYGSVVTGVISNNPTYPSTQPDFGGSEKPTEYMILGTKGAYRLMTTDPVDDNDGNNSNDVRHYVSTFEQYWKNNPTANSLLEDGGKGKVTAIEEDVVLTTEQRGFLENANNTLHKGVWHSYNAWAYSKPWNQRRDGSSNKKLEFGEHWFQTIDMDKSEPKKGYGEFDAVEVSLEAQVILLDQHGWEILRVPLSNTTKLSKYNSPMVENYYWYTKATKTTGYHKYTVSGEPSNTTTSLSGDDIPSGDTDFYVTYTVKPEYANAYSGAAKENETEATPFLLKQGGNYAKTENGSTITTTNVVPARLEDAAENMQWNLRPNFNIDHEMGYKYAGETGAQDGALSKDATEADYMTNGQNGFDPYNVQIQSKAYPQRYFTTNTSGSALDGGVWSATTSSSVNLQNQSTKQTATGYDQTTLNITNATFMVVQDANGNMRLMPRFDHGNVVTNFTALSTQTDAASAGDTGTGTQTVYTQLIPNPTVVHNRSQMTAMNGYYLLDEDFSFDGFTSLGTAAAPFTGTIDGQLNTLDGLTVPLVAYAQNAEIKNVILKGVTINSGYNNPDDENDANNGDTGAICCVAIGSTKIYNCGILPGSVLREDENDENKITGFSGSSVNGSRYVGSIVGFLGGSSRVINCYSYANITGGNESYRAGIVGRNDHASLANDIQTMIMNCMFYGDISTTNNNLYPIYGGEIINNDYHKTNRPNAKLNNYNYFLYEAPYSEGRHIAAANYNCALAAEERFLVRFEFYRHLLNSTRELAAWYAMGNAANGRGAGDNNKMAKWVLDKSIAPYPILKEQGTYYSVVNYDPYNTYDATGAKVSRTSVTKRNQGKDLGTTLTITIRNRTSGGQSAPSGANVETTSLTLPRIDKDTLNYNFNYDKVQLPYYNDVGTGNYTDNRVVTGWKIVSMEGGTAGGYSETNYDAPNYNYADRDTYGKDIYPANTTNKTSGRIFSQGGYFNVPKGVTGITIEPYWGIAAYLSDACYDRYGYNTTDNLTQVGGGQKYINDTDCPLLTGSQKVYTTASNAISALTGASGTATVYDYALVLVGNYHHHATTGKDGPELSSGDTPFTIMSIDLNEDNEPDYCLIYRSGKNKQICPIRFDFITVPGMAMAHKMVEEGTDDDKKDLGIPGNCCPKGWFEITTTGLIKYGQFEHSYSGKTNSPLIFMGGVIDQFVANNLAGSNGNQPSYNNKTKYMLFGDNVWFKMFSNGTHMDNKSPTPHRPISLIGGEYEKLYLSGFFRPDATACTSDSGDKNAECYIDGGKFGEVAGAGQENIDGNVTWMVDHADIRSFYGGGAKASNTNQITGNISTTIKNSYVDLFCGGPKFGDMASEKTVVTSATDCVFGTYFGAGYGGTSIYKYCPEGTNYNKYQNKNYNFNSWVNSTYLSSGKNYYRGKYNVVDGVSIGVSSGYEYEFFAGSGGNVGRLYQKYVSFSLAQTNNVTSELTRCTVKGNFYGGGSLGKVAGTATSTLEGCTVNGSVFGAGYSASIPTASIMAAEKLKVNGVETNPNYNVVTGVYEDSNYPATSEYTWVHVDAALSSGNQTLTDNNEDGTHTIKTNQDTEGLGRVTGKVTLNVTGNTIVKGNKVSMDNDGFVIKDKTTGEPVIVVDPDHVGGVFGGGDASDAENDTEVNINTPSVNAKEGDYNVLNVFGGGNKAEVHGNTVVNLYNGIINKDVFGGGNAGHVRGTATVNLVTPPSNSNGSREGASEGSGSN